MDLVFVRGYTDFFILVVTMEMVKCNLYQDIDLSATGAHSDIAGPIVKCSKMTNTLVL